MMPPIIDSLVDTEFEIGCVECGAHKKLARLNNIYVLDIEHRSGCPIMTAGAR